MSGSLGGLVHDNIPQNTLSLFSFYRSFSTSRSLVFSPVQCELKLVKESGLTRDPLNVGTAKALPAGFQPEQPHSGFIPNSKG